jgi:hypothetical protein
MDPRAGLDVCEKFGPPPGFDPRTVQLVAIRYTDWAIPAHVFQYSLPLFQHTFHTCELVTLCPSKSTIYPLQHFPFAAAFVCQAGNVWTLLRMSVVLPYLSGMKIQRRIIAICGLSDRPLLFHIVS